jgi:hypothetical protein
MSVYLPFFDGGWWSVLINQDGNGYKLFAANKNYEGEDGNYIGFQASASLDIGTVDEWANATVAYLGNTAPTSPAFSTLKTFSGSFQEYRFYQNNNSQVTLNTNSFFDYVMNPYSIDANGINTAPDTLAFRATLGGELYTSSISVHPKVTGSWAITQSFTSNSTFKFISSSLFVTNKEIIYLNQFPAGIKNRVSNKIRQQDEILPYSGSKEVNLPQNTTLSPFISVQQSLAVSGSYTPNIDYVEVAFSPQNEINNDIAGQLGYFNIGEYIGDPRLVSSSAESYPALNDVRDYYFEKYTSNYNIWDYIRLIKYFDNSLFKMIADWTPARTDLASGIVIKQTVLERNKYPVPQLNTETTTSFQMQNDPFVFQNIEVTGSPIIMYTITGSNGGSMPDLGGQTASLGPGFNIVPITQSWTGSTPSLLGPVAFVESSQTEFFDGELSGSTIIVETGSLNGDNVFLQINTTLVEYTASITSSNTTNFTAFVNSSVGNGKIFLYYDSSALLSINAGRNDAQPPAPYDPSI